MLFIFHFSCHILKIFIEIHNNSLLFVAGADAGVAAGAAASASDDDDDDDAVVLVVAQKTDPKTLEGFCMWVCVNVSVSTCL